MFIVLRSQEAATFERNSHRLEVTRFDGVTQGPVHVLIVRGLCLAFNPEQSVVVADERNRTARQGNRANAGRRGEVVVELTIDGSSCVGTDAVRRRRKGDAEPQ